jgi:four helix bundle protein
MGEKIKTFKDLIAWQKAHELALAIYRLTAPFPKSELFGLISQMRRASVSISSNIAEGFSRSGHKEKIHFYYIALSSLTELENQLILSNDLKYIDLNMYEEISSKIVTVQKLINGLIKKLKSLNT